MQVSVGTLLAFTIVAVSILILRYVPPDEVPLPSSLQASFRLSQECDEEKARSPLGDENREQGTSEINDVIVDESIVDPLIEKQLYASMSGELCFDLFYSAILSRCILLDLANRFLYKFIRQIG